MMVAAIFVLPDIPDASRRSGFFRGGDTTFIPFHLQEYNLKRKIRTQLILGLVLVLAWVILLTIHTSVTLDGPSTQQLNLDSSTTTLIVILFFLISAALGFLFWRSLSSSIIQLTKSAEAFGRGELDHRIKVKPSDELGQLAETLNSMVANLSQAQQTVLLQGKMIENMHEGVCLTRADDLSIVYANPRLEEMFGYDPGELIGKHVSVLNAPTEADPEETAAKIMAAALESGYWQGDSHNIRKNGALFWCESSVSKFDHPDHGAVTISVKTGITERKQAEELQDAIYRIAQAADKAESLDILYPAIHKIIQEVMTADNFYIALYDEDSNMISFPYCVDEEDPLFPPQEAGKGLTEYVLWTGKSLLCDDGLFEELIQRDAVELVGVNSPIWLGVPLIVAGKAIGVMVVQDYKDAGAYGEREQRILEFVSSQAAMAIHRKRAEDALAHSHDLMRYVLEHNRSAVAVHDRDLKYIYVSQRYLQEYNVKEHDVIGKHHYDVFPDLPQKWRGVHQRALAGEISSAEDDPYEREDGTVDWTRWECRPWYEADGSVGGFIIYTEVITERKRLEKAMIESQKLAALGTLAAGIAHEINSPLQVITGTSESLQRRLGQRKLILEDLPDGLANINRCAWRVADIVRSLLTYARPSGGDLVSLDLNTLVEDTLLLIEHQLKTWSNVTVRTELAADMPVLNCDSEKISQALINLLSNARDAMPDGGDISIRTKYDEDLNHFILEVTDNGQGIAEEVRSRIFDPFFTTKSVGKGSGLGLSIVKGIVQSHGGEITLDSTIGTGTTFTVALPQEPPQVPPVDAGGRYSKYT
jgi:PAS domain S-box-containing protein